MPEPHPSPIDAIDPRLDSILAEEIVPRGTDHVTKAVVVAQGSRIIAEKYAPGYSAQTPMLGFSLGKSVISILIGILVQDGKLRLSDAALFDAWQDETRRAITVEHLMRMTSGLDLDETGSGFDPANWMLYDEEDMASFAMSRPARARPGTRWAYSSASTHLLAKLIRAKTGGERDSVQRFAAERLFAPLGVTSFVMETDATGTPVGAHYMLAPARAWAQLGILLLHRGVVNGQRLLPETWIDDVTTPTLDSTYGAGFWLNRRSSNAGEGKGLPLLEGLPEDTYYGQGNLGQNIVVIPSRRLVVVRLATSHGRFYDHDGLVHLLRGILRNTP